MSAPPAGNSADLHGWARTILIIATLIGMIIYQDRRVSKLEFLMGEATASLKETAAKLGDISERMARQEGLLARPGNGSK